MQARRRRWREGSSQEAIEQRALLPDLRAITGPDAKPVLCFDRGGWSPDLFAHVTATGFDLLTYRKAEAGKDIPAISGSEFTTVRWTGDDGRERGYDLAETSIELPVTSGGHTPRKDRQVLTLRHASRPPAAKKDLAAAQAARQDKLAALRSPAPGTTTVITNAARGHHAHARLALRQRPQRRDFFPEPPVFGAVPLRVIGIIVEPGLAVLAQPRARDL